VTDLMATVHPSRQGRVPNAAATAGGKVYMVDGERKHRLLIGSQGGFNRMRMDLIRASCEYASTLRGSKSLTDYLSSWADFERERILFDRIYPAHHWQSMYDLQQARLSGVYWFVNHNDSNGSLSVGQIADLIDSLEAIGEKALMTAGWPQRLSNDFYNLLVHCFNTPCCILYTSEAPPPSDVVEAVGAALASLQKAGIVKPVAADSCCSTYDPSSPSLSGSKESDLAAARGRVSYLLDQKGS
jgi:hypothetical protein